MACAESTNDKVFSLKEHAYRLIRQKLVGGHLQAGCHLSEYALAREIGISRGPIREAISQLTSEGLVKHHPRRGVFVREPSRREMEELYEVRCALESFASAKAAMIATKEQIDELQRLHQKILTTVQDCQAMPNQVADNNLTNRFLANDMRFHLLVINAAGNQRLFDIVENCKILIRVFANIPVQHNFQLIIATQQHASIIEAICRHDSQAARDLMTSHIATSSKFLLDEHYGKAGSNAL